MQDDSDDARQPEAGPSNILSSSGPPPSPSPIPQLPTSRSGRTIRFPRHYEDFLPTIPTPLAHIPSAHHANVPADPIDASVTPPAASELDTDEPLQQSGPYETDPNAMGVFRRYPTLPTLDPERTTTLRTLCEGSAFDTNPVSLSDSVLPTIDLMDGADPWAPFSNYSSALMMSWHYSGSTTKTLADINHLAFSLCDSNFRPTEFDDFSSEKENERIDSFIKESSTTFQKQHSWHQSSVKFRLPCSQFKFSSGEQDAPEFTVDEVYHRRLVDIIRGQ